MPFFDDSGIARERHRGPVIGALAVLAEQVERMVALSIAWALTLFPAVLAIAFPGLPPLVRVGLALISASAVVPATGALYALAARALDGEQIGRETAVDALRECAVRSLRTLTPLVVLVGILVWAVVIAGATGFALVEVPARVLLLLLLVCSAYWGPLTLARPDASAVAVLRESARLVWLRPGTTLKTCLAVLVIAVLSVLTVAGAVLIAPAAIALLQVNLAKSVEGGGR